MPEPEVWQFEVHPSTNVEVKTMSVLVALFERLDAAEIGRVLRWAADAYGADIGSPTPPAESERPEIPDLMAALEQSIIDAKAARDRHRSGDGNGRDGAR